MISQNTNDKGKEKIAEINTEAWRDSWFPEEKLNIESIAIPSQIAIERVKTIGLIALTSSTYLTHILGHPNNAFCRH